MAIVRNQFDEKIVFESKDGSILVIDILEAEDTKLFREICEFIRD